MFDEFGLPPSAVRALSRLVWVMGPARGGSTVVGLTLGRHPQHLYTGHISYFLENIWLQKKKLSAKEIERRFCSVDLPLFEKIREIWGAEMLSLVNAGIAEASKKKDMPALFKFHPLIWMLSNSLEGKNLEDIKCWQMKTNNWRGLNLIRKGFPESHFVFVARDPRASVTSLAIRSQKRRGIDWSDRVRDQEVIESTLYWRTISSVSRGFAARYPDRASIVRYESFIEQTQPTLNSVYAHTTGRTLSDEELAPLLQDIGGGATNDPTERYRTISRAPLTRWRSVLTTDQLAIIARLAGRAAAKDGYELDVAENGMSLSRIAGRIGDRTIRARLVAKALALPMWERFAT